MTSKPSDNTIVKTIATGCLSVRLRLMNRIVSAIYDEALRPHAIKASQLNILVAVSASESTTSKQLCRALHMDASTFSRTLARLKKNGWLQVEPSGEGKVLKIQVTEKGLEKITQAYGDWEMAQEKATAVIGEVTAETILAAGNRHLLGAMEK